MSCIEYKDYTEQFKYLSKLGSGNCATVYKIQDIKNKQAYALKYAKFDTVSQLVLALQQIQVVRALDHPAAIQVYYYFVKNDVGQRFLASNIELGIIMELGEQSLQQDMINRKKRQKFYTVEQIQEIMKILIDFFAHCQMKGYMHRDIKPANILIMPPQQNKQSQGQSKTQQKYSKYKICDFGFAIKNHQLSDKNIAGTACYASPKIQNKFKNSQIYIKGNNFKDDVYSLGVTIIELCILQAVQQVPPSRFLQKISNRYGLKISSLIQLMIQIQQQKRLDFIQLRQILPKHLIRKSNQCNNNILNSKISRINKNLIKINSNSNNQQNKSIFIKQQDENQLKTAISENQSDEVCSIKQQYIKNNEVNKQLQIKKYTQKVEQENKKKLDNQKLKQIFTPKLNKIVDKLMKKTQQKNQRQSKIQKQFVINLQSLKDNQKDKIKTKRKSQILNNNISNNIFYQPNKLNKIQSNTNNQKIKQYQKHNKQNKNQKSNISQQHILCKFENFQIQNIQIIQLIIQKPKYQQIVIICVIVSNKIYIIHELKKNIQIIQLKLNNNNKQQIFTIKYCIKTQYLKIIFTNNNILIFKILNLLNQLLKCHTLISIQNLQSNIIQTKTTNLSILQIDKKNGNIIKAYCNGDVYQNDKLLLKRGCLQKIVFVKKYQKSLYIATCNGFIYKYYIPGSQVSDMSKMIGCYDCKSTLLSFQITKNQKLNTLLVVAITVSGFLLYLQSNLQLIQIKKISKNCLRACQINLKLQKGKRIIAIDTFGNIINQHGVILCQTGVISSTNLNIINEGRNAIISTQEGSILEFQIKQQKNQTQAINYK